MEMKRSLLFFVFVLGCQFTFARTGDDTRDSNDELYRAALIKKARAHARLSGSEDREKTLEARFLVKQTPFGEVVSVEKIQGSGDPEYDRAIWEGIWRASPFPKKKDGTVESEVRLNFIETPAAEASR
jgi:colicin import membrane protein